VSNAGRERAAAAARKNANTAKNGTKNNPGGRDEDEDEDEDEDKSELPGATQRHSADGRRNEQINSSAREHR